MMHGQKNIKRDKTSHDPILFLEDSL